MRFLLIIFLFVATKVYSFDDLSFFEISLGDTVSYSNILTYEEIEKINSIDEIEKYYTYLTTPLWTENFTFEYIPNQKNSNFDDYSYLTTPNTGIIVTIRAMGEPVPIETCDSKLTFYENFYKNKYKSIDKLIVEIKRNINSNYISVKEINSKSDEYKKINSLEIRFFCEHHWYDKSVLFINSNQYPLMKKEKEDLTYKILLKKDEIIQSEVSSETDTTGL
tara:strand:- start:613 stop:1275 length:663 start_codon:yes stop_codon:yes gene_type:complete